MKKEKNKCHKSLLKRIRFLTNATTAVSVIIMMIVMIGIFAVGFMLLEKTLSSYYTDRIEEQVERFTYEEDGIIAIENKNILNREIEKLNQSVPFLSIEVIVNNDVVYREIGNVYFLDTLRAMTEGENEIEVAQEITHEIKEDITENIQGEIPQNYNIRYLTTSNGRNYGRISVGVDAKLMATLGAILVVITIPIGLILMLVMGLVANLVTKPILSPINRLTTQLNRLADEEYETVAPIVDVSQSRVKEVYELSLATNRLLDKMLNYNEVITQSEKMASIGQLTAAITHEINTPLGAINANVNLTKMFSESISEDMTVDELNEIKQEIVEASELSEDACKRIDKIIRSLKLYSRIDQVDFMEADIHESLNSVIVLTTNLHKNRIVVHKDYGDIPKINCHIGLINQVFMNIFINAIQAIEDKGEVTISTSCDDKNVYVAISDTGCGISVNNIYNIFQYGFTTKQPGSGSGIGLALSNNIIKKHNGNIYVDSTEGEGSTFTVTIPIKQEDEDEELI